MDKSFKFKINTQIINKKDFNVKYTIVGYHGHLYKLLKVPENDPDNIYYGDSTIMEQHYKVDLTSILKNL